MRDRLNPDGQPIDPNYRLQIQLTSTVREAAFRRDETSTRAQLILRSSFVLRSVDDDRAVYTGRSSIFTSYNILDSQYPTNISRADAFERGLREMSEDIKLRLAVYFASAEGRDL